MYYTFKLEDNPNLTSEAFEFHLDMIGSGENRHDSDLIETFKHLGNRFGGTHFCEVKIVTISCPFYYIQEYDGKEIVRTPNNTKYQVIQTDKVTKKYPEYFI